MELPFYIAFAAYIACGPLPPPMHGVSRMGYFVRMGLMSLVTSMAIVIITYFYRFVMETGVHNPMYPLAIASMYATCGVYAGTVALRRSVDSGKGRRFSALGMIPFGNLALAFAAPRFDIVRSAYAPRTGAARAAIGFVVFLGGAVMSGVILIYLDSRNAAESEIDRFIAAAPMPNSLEQFSTMTGIDRDINVKNVSFIHELHPRGGLMWDGNERAIRAAIEQNICDDETLGQMMSAGYMVTYVYMNEKMNRRPLRTSFNSADCRWVRGAVSVRAISQ